MEVSCYTTRIEALMSNAEIITKESSFSEVEFDWQFMENSLAPGYFQSSSWQQLWHRKINEKGFKPLVVSISNGHKFLLMSSTVTSKKRMLGLFKQNATYLNSSGSEEFDVICPENCQPLVSLDAPKDVFGQMINYLVSEINVKQIFIRAIPLSVMHQLQQGCQSCEVEFIVEKKSAHHWINLESLRLSKRDHLSSLNSRARSTIRKTIEKYEFQFGKVNLRSAENSVQSKEWLGKLIDLNLQRFRSKGRNSSFNIPFLQEFHNELIDLAFPKGEVVMVRLEAGEQIIGYIYGFLFNKVISIYQTGFVFEADNKLSPGMVAHHLLAQESMNRDINRYDFLAGDYQYKRILSNEHGELVWLRICVPNLLLSIERFLKNLKRRITRGIVGRESHAQ